MAATASTIPLDTHLTAPSYSANSSLNLTDLPPVSGLPAVLVAADAGHYAAVFRAQESADWTAADNQIAATQDKCLLGTVLAQRYLSKGYQADFSELSGWLAQYADQPEARAIWSLAVHRAAGRPVVNPTVDRLSNTDTSLVSRLLADPSPASLQRPREFALGLTAWREQRWADAARNFESVASSKSVPSWFVAAGAYWAARTHLKLKQPEHVDEWLMLAAHQPRTFYGMLAREGLGLPADHAVVRQAVSAAEAEPVSALPAGKRALALFQIGQGERGQAELRALAVHANGRLANSIVAVADAANMPALVLALGNQTSAEMPAERVLYPMPAWRPRNGFSVDRALMYALILEESRFDSGAQSGSGAAGLMQLMPGTAREVARVSGIAYHGSIELTIPELNMSLGQEYMKLLLGNDQINGNLILALAAYNTGPGALPKWKAHTSGHEDPLLFIEDLPRPDTRIYVQRVMTSLWVYRQKLGQPLPDLAALAANMWPNYLSTNDPTESAAQYASSR